MALSDDPICLLFQLFNLVAHPVGCCTMLMVDFIEGMALRVDVVVMDEGPSWWRREQENDRANKLYGEEGLVLSTALDPAELLSVSTKCWGRVGEL